MMYFLKKILFGSTCGLVDWWIVGGGIFFFFLFVFFTEVTQKMLDGVAWCWGGVGADKTNPRSQSGSISSPATMIFDKKKSGKPP